MRIRIFVLIALLGAGSFTACRQLSEPGGGSSVERAFEQRDRDVQVQGEGVVTRILTDDTKGSPHQRFIVRLASGRTVLIQHNIELAPRVAELKEGDTVAFFGEYIWNDQGGLVHWTHHDPAGRHVAGWVKHNGRTFQ